MIPGTAFWTGLRFVAGDAADSVIKRAALLDEEIFRRRAGLGGRVLFGTKKVNQDSTVSAFSAALR
jgi:hypothetical protein